MEKVSFCTINFSYVVEVNSAAELALAYNTARIRLREKLGDAAYAEKAYIFVCRLP